MQPTHMPRVLVWMCLPVLLASVLCLAWLWHSPRNSLLAGAESLLSLLWILSLFRYRWAAWTLGGLSCAAAALFLAATVSNLFLVPNLPAAALLAPVALLFSSLAWVLLFHRGVREWLKTATEQTHLNQSP